MYFCLFIYLCYYVSLFIILLIYLYCILLVDYHGILFFILFYYF